MANVKCLFRYLIEHKRGRELKSLTSYYGTRLFDWDHRVKIHNESDFYHATTAPGVGGQPLEILVRRIRLGENQDGQKSEDLSMR